MKCIACGYDDNTPVKYFDDGGTYAVYGSSSIAYVEKLRAKIKALETKAQEEKIGRIGFKNGMD